MSKATAYNYLREVNDSVIEELANYNLTHLPLQFASSISLYRSIIERCDYIAERSKDKDMRVSLNASQIAKSCLDSLNLTIADSQKVYQAINNLQQARKKQLTEVAVDSNDGQDFDVGEPDNANAEPQSRHLGKNESIPVSLDGGEIEEVVEGSQSGESP